MASGMQPHNLDAEQAVLAACLVDRYAATLALDLLEPADFYHFGNGLIFGAVCDVYGTGSAIDPFTVADALGSKLGKAGGRGYLLDLAGSIPTTAHAEHYAGIVAKKAQRRRALAILAETTERLMDPDLADDADPASEAAMRLVQAAGVRGAEGGPVALGDVIEAVHDDIEQANRTRGAGFKPAVTTGLYDLDELVRIEAGSMIVLGARPSAGKTALAMQIIEHAGHNPDRPVLFQSLEMDRKAIARRFYQAKTGAGLQRMLAGYMSADERELAKLARKEGRDWSVMIDDRVGLTVAQIAANAHRTQVMLGKKLGLVVIDHMIKVRAADPRANGHQRLTQISNDIKEMGRNLGVPVLVLTQLNRSVETENREPTASDLRESGSIEEDADAILLLHRPDRDKPMSVASLNVAKNRNGECGKVDLVFTGARMRFECAAKLAKEPAQ